MKEWNIQALELDFINNQLPKCNNDFEVSMLTAIHGMEVKKLAEKLKELGKLTPVGEAIASKYGFNVD